MRGPSRTDADLERSLQILQSLRPRRWHSAVSSSANNAASSQTSATPFIPEAYRRDVPKAEVHVLDAGHFAPDTAADQIAQLVRGFMK